MIKLGGKGDSFLTFEVFLWSKNSTLRIRLLAMTTEDARVISLVDLELSLLGLVVNKDTIMNLLFGYLVAFVVFVSTHFVSYFYS